MKNLKLVGIILSLYSLKLSAQGPEVTSWIIDATTTPGYGGYASNVQQVQYSANNVYVSATCIPGYDIGPWAGSPNVPSNQNFVFKITRTPVQNTGTPINTGLGHIGVWTNGVSIFNAKDAMSYLNQGVWNQNAIIVEGGSFDQCLGHPAPNGEYHHHLNPICLYNATDSSTHSPIIGYAFDGFPIYGSWGYANVDGTGGIKRMVSSYRKRSITTRTTLPDGSTASSAGPNVSTTYPLGYYIEDFEYIAGLGDLDTHNGRFCVTPEYPAGTYAYFVTVDADYVAAFPYTLGLTYYGTVQPGNTGPGSGHNTPTETVVTYTATGVNEAAKEAMINMYPNPANEHITIDLSSVDAGTAVVKIVNLLGQVVMTETVSSNIQQDINVAQLPEGVYQINVECGGMVKVGKMVIARR